VEPFLGEPGYGDLSVLKTCGDQEWIVCPFLHVDADVVFMYSAGELIFIP
jgi:hypothetical protein